jgi:hypothetical protein
MSCTVTLIETRVNYVGVGTPQYPIEYTCGTIIFRKGKRGGAFVIDMTLTPIGFSGDEFIDWINIKSVE